MKYLYCVLCLQDLYMMAKCSKIKVLLSVSLVLSLALCDFRVEINQKGDWICVK